MQQSYQAKLNEISAKLMHCQSLFDKEKNDKFRLESELKSEIELIQKDMANQLHLANTQQANLSNEHNQMRSVFHQQ